MKRSWMTGMLAGLGVGAVMFVLTGALQAQAARPPTGRVACVDIGQVFREYQRMKDITEELRNIEEKLQLENDQRRTSIDALQATVDAMDRADPAYVKKISEVLEAKVSHRSWFELQQAHIGREIGLATDGIYRDILQATEALARQAAYDIVVYYEEYEAVSMNPEELRTQMRSRRVVYVNPDVDITQFVTDKLNEDYRSRPHKPQLYIP